MNEEFVNKTLAQTEVLHGDKWFFVSTINRRSSADGQIYAETLVWEWDRKTAKRGDMIGQDENCKDSLFAHQRMVQRLFDTGKCDEVVSTSSELPQTEAMTEDEIFDAVVEIMLKDGPDGHCDGSAIITNFIVALMRGEGKSWFDKYIR